MRLFFLRLVRAKVFVAGPAARAAAPPRRGPGGRSAGCGGAARRAARSAACPWGGRRGRPQTAARQLVRLLFLQLVRTKLYVAGPAARAKGNLSQLAKLPAKLEQCQPPPALRGQAGRRAAPAPRPHARQPAEALLVVALAALVGTTSALGAGTASRAGSAATGAGPVSASRALAVT